MSNSRIKLIILILFFFSGLSGLVYELAWMRELSLIFGNTTSAISTVLTAFFAGLAIGSRYFGRLIDKKTDALKIYGLLELGIGIYCLLTPMIFTLTGELYAGFFRGTPLLFPLQLIIRFLLCFMVLIIPTTLMGGTLPVLSRYFTNIKEKPCRSAGGLYAANTLGAVAGALLAGFILIETAGIRNTVFLASAVNIAAGLIILLIAPRRSARPVQSIEHHSLPVPSAPYHEKRLRTVILIAFALSGFASMAYEVLWSRILILVIGSTTYAFTVLLVTFLSGIAAGSFIFSKLADNRRNLLTQFAFTEILIGAFAVAAVPVLGQASHITQELLSGMRDLVDNPWGAYTAIQFILSSIVIFMPAFLMGATFPLVSGLFTNTEKTGRDIGNIYSVNTFGGIVGSFAAGFLFVPLLGVQKGLMVMALLNISLGVLLFFHNRNIRFFFKVCISLFIVLLYVSGVTFIPAWNPALFRGAHVYQGSKENIIFQKEGIGGTVAVTYKDGIRTLFINGESESSNEYFSLMTQYLLGYLPLLIHPGPASVLEVGLGGGITLGTAGNLEKVKEIESVEIIGAAEEAASLFSRENNEVLHDPRVRLTVNDGRNYLLLTNRKYDIITGNTTHPWTADASNILSREYFIICRQRLNANGLMSQWVPLQFMRPAALKSIIKTFHSVFPHTSVWFSNMDVILIGSVEELEIDFNKLSAYFMQSNIRRDLESVDVDSPFSLLSRFIMNEKEINEYVGHDARIIYDDRPFLEFSAPKNRYAYTLAGNLRELISHRGESSPLIPSVHMNGALEKGKITGEIDKHYRSMTYNIKGIIEENNKNIRGAVTQYRKSLELNSSDNIARHNLAGIYTSEGFAALHGQRLDEAVMRFREALNIYPGFTEARFGLSSIYIKKRAFDRAAEELKNIIAVDPSHAKAHNNLGGIYGMKGLHEKAFLEFTAALEADPYYVNSYNNLASYYLIHKKDKRKAFPYLWKSLEIDPYQEKAEWIRKMINDI